MTTPQRQPPDSRFPPLYHDINTDFIAPTPGADDDHDEDPALPLRDRAFALHCRGHHSRAIADRLHIPARTIRSWVAADLAATAKERASTRRQLRATAVERLLVLAAASWDAFDTLTIPDPSPTQPDPIPPADGLQPASTPSANTSPLHSTDPSVGSSLPRSLITPSAPIPSVGTLVPRSPSSPDARPTWANGLSPARFLALALTAYREVNRLQGLHATAAEDAKAAEPPVDPRPAEIRNGDLSRLILIPPPQPPAFVTPQQQAAWRAFLAQWEREHPEDKPPLPARSALLPIEEAIPLYNAQDVARDAARRNPPSTAHPSAPPAALHTASSQANGAPRNLAEMATSPAPYLPQPSPDPQSSAPPTPQPATRSPSPARVKVQVPGPIHWEWDSVQGAEVKRRGPPTTYYTS